MRSSGSWPLRLTSNTRTELSLWKGSGDVHQPLTWNMNLQPDDISFQHVNWSVDWSRYLGAAGLIAYFISPREVDFVKCDWAEISTSAYRVHPQCLSHQSEVGGWEILPSYAGSGQKPLICLFSDLFLFLFWAAVLLWRMLGSRLSGSEHQLNL